MTSSPAAIALPPSVTDLAARDELIDTQPSRARAAIAGVLRTLSPADWAFLRLSPQSVLAQVVSIASCLHTGDTGDEDTDSYTSLYALADAVEVPVEDELRAWVRTTVRELAGQPRLHAIPTAATDDMRTTPDAVSRRRAHHTPQPVGAVVLHHRARDERSAERRRRREADADAYFADRPVLVA
ncbi:hypothetical protein ACQP1G_16420 [Nocardia sp. CA-107356]|uniref:hypothetical protein n=1 Tax=Nocardia sp. CA-107356 TaxID=3239972 RepID=UPI003D927E73